MKKLILILFLASIILISGCVKLPQACKADARVCPDGTAVGRDPSSKNCEEFYPCLETNHFDIYYSFGVGEENIFDTKNNLYVKDMVCEDPRQYTIKLSDNEKNRIYNSIIENDLLNIKEDFTENCNLLGICKGVTPLSTSTLKIEFHGETKAIKWSANYYRNNDPDLNKFRSVEAIIRDLISRKEAELNIEQPKCGYL